MLRSAFQGKLILKDIKVVYDISGWMENDMNNIEPLQPHRAQQFEVSDGWGRSQVVLPPLVLLAKNGEMLGEI